MNQKVNNSSSYRPEIDGLRALAVLSVVIYHAFPNILKGGFIGVDIFFCNQWLFNNNPYIKKPRKRTIQLPRFF